MKDDWHSVRADSVADGHANVIGCQECGASSGHEWGGWRAYRTDDPTEDEPPALVFYCPDCATREFGPSGSHG